MYDIHIKPWVYDVKKCLNVLVDSKPPSFFRNDIRQLSKNVLRSSKTTGIVDLTFIVDLYRWSDHKRCDTFKFWISQKIVLWIANNLPPNMLLFRSSRTKFAYTFADLIEVEGLSPRRLLLQCGMNTRHWPAVCENECVVQMQNKY